MTSILLAIKKEESRKSVKRVATNGGFPKIPKKKPKSQKHVSSANITMPGGIMRRHIVVIVTMLIKLPIAIVLRKRITTISTKIRSE